VLGSGNKIVDGNVNQVNFNVAFENGLYLNLWSIAEKLERVEEVDYTIGYARNLNNKWAVDVSFGWFDISPFGKNSDGDLFTPIVRIIRTVSDSVDLYGAIEYSVVKNQSENNGTLVYVGAGTSFDFKKINATVKEGVLH